MTSKGSPVPMGPDDRTWPSYAEILADEEGPVPPDLKCDTRPDLGTGGVARTRYFSPSFHQLEMERMWPRVWQMACRVEEVAEPGDIVPYDIGDHSVMIVHGADGALRAFHNSCLHRGTRLCDGNSHMQQIRCPFHGITWALDGALKNLPCAWDFPHVEPADFALPQAKIGTWGGFVFVNFDPDAMPLETYLEDVPEHCAASVFDKRVMTGFYRKRLPANWKLSIEAFLEAYHVPETHYHTLDFSGEASTQYDVFPGRRHTSRFLTPIGEPSPLLAERPAEQDILRSMLSLMSGSEDVAAVPAGKTLRQHLAEQARAANPGGIAERLSTAETVDIMEYFIFPNMVLFRGLAVPIVYRFRPDGNDPNACQFELMVLSEVADGQPAPDYAEVEELGDRPFVEADTLPHWLGFLYDQDVSNLSLQQRGIRSSVRPDITLSRYQEVRIRHLHQTLDSYIGESDGR